MGMWLDLDDCAADHPKAWEELRCMRTELSDKRALLAEWMKFAADIQCGDACGQDWLDGLRLRTSRHLTPNAKVSGGGAFPPSA